MTIKSNLKPQPVSWIISNNKNSKLNKDISIQRKEIWDAEKKSNLITSLLLDVPIESLLFEDAGSRSYNVLDGKQRVLTLCSFVDDGFRLSPKMRIKEIDGVELVGKSFSELPEEMQGRILDYTLSISILSPLNDEDRAVVFFMRNQAAPLSRLDLLPVVLGNDAMQTLSSLCQHNFMREKVKLTVPALRKRDDLKIILYYLILKSDRDMGFSGAEITSFADDIKSKEFRIGVKEVLDLLQYLDKAIERKWSYMKLTNVPIIMRVGQAAMEKGIEAKDFGDRVNRFFAINPLDEEYQETLRGGSAKKVNVQQRLRILMGILYADGASKTKQVRLSDE